MHLKSSGYTKNKNTQAKQSIKKKEKKTLRLHKTKKEYFICTSYVRDMFGTQYIYTADNANSAKILFASKNITSLIVLPLLRAFTFFHYLSLAGECDTALMALFSCITSVVGLQIIHPGKYAFRVAKESSANFPNEDI